ncbi:MAG TPA: hypothetical protein VN956_00695 [Pyrinomonadaceae bacterium]|nr:hypothetical protein [Pyrinomonadaceae bacterium]
MNGKAHTIGGMVGGPLVGAALAANAQRQPTVAEICGWLAGGVLGARGPDLLEPAICPHHRKFCHSGCAFILNIATIQSQTLQSSIQGLMKSAEDYRLLAALDTANGAYHQLRAYLLEFLAGLLPGLLGGYASHLVLDSTTAFGLPLF